MRKLSFSLLSVTLAALVCGLASGDPIDDAIQQARTTGKHVLVDFWAGWCPWCIKMDQTFQDPRVAALVRDRFVYVKLDCGRGDQHQDRQRQVGLTGYPLVVVISVQYKVLGKQDGYSDANRFLGFLQQHARGGGGDQPPPPEPGGLAGSWRDSSGNTFVFTGNQVQLQTVVGTMVGTVTNVSANRYQLTFNGGPSLVFVINSQVNNTMNVTLVMPNGATQVVDMQRQNQEPEPQPQPTGEWDYLAKLYPDTQIGQWSRRDIHFEGPTCTNSYEAYTYGGKGTGAFSLANLRHPGRPSMLEVRLGVNDETAPDVGWRIEIRLDNQPPRECTVRLRQSALVRVPVSGVGRVEFTVSCLNEYAPWQSVILVEPRVYY